MDREFDAIDEDVAMIKASDRTYDLVGHFQQSFMIDRNSQDHQDIHNRPAHIKYNRIASLMKEATTTITDSFHIEALTEQDDNYVVPCEDDGEEWITIDRADPKELWQYIPAQPKSCGGSWKLVSGCKRESEDHKTMCFGVILS